MARSRSRGYTRRRIRIAYEEDNKETLDEKIVPVIAEFTCKHQEKHYYIGRSLSDISQDADIFDWLDLRFNRIINMETAQELSLGLLNDGYKSVIEGTKSYKLRTP